MSIALAEAARPTDLSRLAEKAQREHGLVLQAGESMVMHAIAAGEALLAAKDLVGHGEWEQWLTDNVPDWSMTTPRTYMRMARYKDKLVARGVSNIREARRLLAGEADSRRDPLVVAEIQSIRAQTGKPIRQIAAEVGVSQSAVWRVINPKAAERQRKRLSARSMAGRRELNRKERDRAVKKVGGPIAEAYALVRRACQELDRAAADAEKGEVKQAILAALGRLHNAEDDIGKAVRLG